jgi:hypothetical protein
MVRPKMHKRTESLLKNEELSQQRIESVITHIYKKNDNAD